MNTISVRCATLSDAPLILDFVKELARFEKAEQEVLADVAALEKSLFGRDAVARALICEHDKHPVGYAVYFFNYSTWLGKKGLYIEDIYISPSKRRSGLGKALFKELARIARENDCGRMEFSVLDWNQSAIRFYESLGASAKPEWIGYRLTEQQIEVLANE